MAAMREGGARRITSSSPNVATASATHCPGPALTLVENCRRLVSNMAWASHAPSIAPSSWQAT
jgi:hypothetical protein